MGICACLSGLPEEATLGPDQQVSEVKVQQEDLTSMHRTDEGNSELQDGSEGQVNQIRENILKQRIEVVPTSTKKKSVKFLRDPSPRRTSPKRMLALERLLDENADQRPVLGETDLAAEASRRVQKADEQREKDKLEKEQLLPPTYFAAYVVPKMQSPFDSQFQKEARRVVGHVDTGANPYSVVSETFVSENMLRVSSFSTVLGLGDKTAPAVKSSSACDFLLRVSIGDRARLVHLKAVVWPDDKCTCPLLVGREDALRTGLIIFVHDNDLRESILGLAPLRFDPEQDPISTVGRVATIISEEEDQLLHERISPI